MGTVARRTRFANALDRAISHPRWLHVHIKSRWARLKGHRDFSLADYSTCIRSDMQAVAELLEIAETECQRIERHLWKPPRTADHGSSWGGGNDLLDMIGVFVRVAKPDVVLEAGVAHGLTSAVVLHAMEQNGKGHLYSVDLPPLSLDVKNVGSAIPEELKARWTLKLGPTESVLAVLARQVAPVDLFVHDADHSFEAQLRDYRAVWPYLRPGGVLFSDDVDNPAFLEFAAEMRTHPLLVGHGRAAVGAMRKP